MHSRSVDEIGLPGESFERASPPLSSPRPSPFGSSRRRGKDRRIVSPTTLLSKRQEFLVRAWKHLRRKLGENLRGARETKYAGWSGRVCGGPQAATSFTPIQPPSLPPNTAFRFTSYLALTSRFASPPCHRVPLFAALVVLPRFVPFRRASSTIFFCSPLHLLLDPIGVEPRPTRLDRDASDRSLSSSPRSVPTKESPRIVLIPLSREDAASLNKSLRQDIDKRLLIYRPVDREGISDTKTMRHHGSRFVESNVRAFIFTPFFPRRRCDGGGVARHATYFRRNCGYEGLAKEGPGKTRPRAACRGTRRH